MLKKYTFKSQISGYNILFLGAINGNETEGTNAIFKVVEKFASRAISPLKGSVSFIPICNPLAFEKNISYIDEDLNSTMNKNTKAQTYEQQIANELVDYIASADIVIDLRSSLLNSQSYIINDYPDTLADKIATIQNISYIIKGLPEIHTQNNKPYYSISHCAHSSGKTCLTVGCGSCLEETTLQNAYYTIMSTLLYLGILQGYPATPIKQQYIITDKLYLKTKSGKLAQNFRNFETIEQGKPLIIYDDGEQITCPRDSIFFTLNDQPKISETWFCLGHIEN